LFSRCLARLLEPSGLEFGEDNVKRDVRTVRRQGMCVEQMRERGSRLPHLQQDNPEVVGGVGLLGVQSDGLLKLGPRFLDFLFL